MSQSGIRGLYAGYGAAVVGIFVHRMSYFALTPILRFGGYFSVRFASTVAGFLSGILSYPFDTIRKRMLIQLGTKKKPGYRNSFHCGVQIYHEEGLKGFYFGFDAKVMPLAITKAFIQACIRRGL